MNSNSLRFSEYLLSAPALDGVRRRLRAFHSGFILAALSRFMTRPLLLSSGRVMVVAPHQDDETLGCGGLIALKRQRGASVKVVFLTDGGKAPLPADGGLARADLSQARAEEARAAMQTLGVPESDLQFLGYPDGALKELSPERREEIIERLRALIVEQNPVKIFVPHWDDGHGDHEAAFAYSVEAVRRSKIKVVILQYAIWGPWLHPLFRPDCWRDLRRAYRLPIGAVLGEKGAAIGAYASQVATLPDGFLGRFHRPYELFFPAHEISSGKREGIDALKSGLCSAGLRLDLQSGIPIPGAALFTHWV